MNKPLQFLIVLLVGLIMGAVCTSIAIEALRKGTEFSRGVMAVQAAHAMALNKLAKDKASKRPDFVVRMITPLKRLERPCRAKLKQACIVACATAQSLRDSP